MYAHEHSHLANTPRLLPALLPSALQPATLSMTIKIHGVKAFAGTQYVTIVLRELGVPYEVVYVDVASSAHKSADWIADMHPFGQTPVLVSIEFPGTRKIWE